MNFNMRGRFNGAVKGSAGNFDMFRGIRKGSGQKAKKRYDSSNLIQKYAGKRGLVKGAIGKVDLLTKLSWGERQVAKQLLRYIKEKPNATYADVFSFGLKEYNTKPIKTVDKLGRIVIKSVGQGMAKRICDELILNGLIIDPGVLIKIKEKQAKAKKKKKK
jgi:hypothetical protein